MSSPLTNLGLYGDFEICDKDIIQNLNANFQLLDNLVQLSFDGIVPVLPSSPNDGDKYILSTDGSVNLWDGSQWITYQAQEGYIGYNKADSLIYIFDGIDWISFSGENISFDNTGTGLTATNLQAAIVELQNGKANVVHTHDLSDINQSGANIGDSILWNGTAWVPVVFNATALFPVGKIDMTISITPPNSLRWLRLDQEWILDKTGETEELFNFLSNEGLFTSDPNGLFKIDAPLDPSKFVIRSFSGLGTRSVGGQSVGGNFKDGPIGRGIIQEDQMQKIEGAMTGNRGISATDEVQNGAIAYAEKSSGLNRLASGTGAAGYTMTFDSSKSVGARTSAATTGETRSNTFGINYWIRY